MSVSTRLMLLIGYLAVLVVLLGGVGVYAVSRMSQAVALAVQHNYATMVAAREMSEALEREEAAVFALALADDSAPSHDKLRQSRARFDNALHKAKTAMLRAPVIELQAMSKLESARRAYVEASQRLVQQPSGAAAIRAYYGQVEPRYRELADRIDELERMREHDNQQAEERAQQLAWTSRVWISVLASMAFASIVWLTNHLQRTIIAPLSVMARTAHALGKGELQRRLAYGRRDELGELARRLNEMVDQIQANRQRWVEREAVFSQAFEAMLDQFQEPLAVLDSSGRVMWSNHAFRSVLGEFGIDERSDVNAITRRLDARYEAQRDAMMYRGVRPFGELLRLQPRQQLRDG